MRHVTVSESCSDDDSARHFMKNRGGCVIIKASSQGRQVLPTSSCMYTITGRLQRTLGIWLRGDDESFEASNACSQWCWIMDNLARKYSHSLPPVLLCARAVDARRSQNRNQMDL